MAKDYYSYSSATLLRYTEDCSSVVGTAAARDGESSQRNEHELSDEQGARQIGRNKSCGEKAKGGLACKSGVLLEAAKGTATSSLVFLALSL